MQHNNQILIEIGHVGPRVVEIQKALIKHGYNKIVADGIFGKYTFRAVVDFQAKNGLVVDGVVGPITAKKLMEVTKEPISIVNTIEYKPLPIKVKNSMKSMNEAFGDFRSPAFDSTYLTPIVLPASIFHDKKKRETLVHKLVVNAIMAVVSDMIMSGLKFYTFDGCGNKRLMRGSKRKWSTHSWYCAFDFDQARNPMGTPGQMDPRIVEIFEKHGFYWLGRRKRNPDPMHFQACVGYE